MKISNIYSRCGMPLAVLGLLLGLVSSPTFAQSPPDDGRLISKEVYGFPKYEEAERKTFAKLYASKEEYEGAVSDKVFEFSKLTYLSDGLRVIAYLYKPKTVKAKHPVIVFNRGGLVRTDIAPELISIFHRLASEGFVVIAPMYRQSDTGEGVDETGGADVDDLMNVIPLIKSFDFVDLANVFLYGESRGGVMTYIAIKRGFPANAAAVFGAITNVGNFLKDNSKDFPLTVLNKIWPRFEENKATILKSRSAVEWVEEISTPLLIMHGGADAQVSPLQSISIAAKLQGLGKSYQLIVYAGDNHVLSKNAERRDREAASWFKSYLK